MDKEIIGFLIINYNNYIETSKCIRSILQIKTPSEIKVKIVIVDNNSAIEYIIKLKSQFENIENIHFIESKKNCGYFGGINLGIDYIKKFNPLFLVVGNNDLIFKDENFIINLFSEKLKDNILIIAPKIILPNGQNKNPHYEKPVSKFRKFMFYLYYRGYLLSLILTFLSRVYKSIKNIMLIDNRKKNNNKKRVIYAAQGACFILTKYFFNHFNRLDDNIFLFGEEIILAEMVKSVRSQIIYCPNLLLFHMEHSNVKLLTNRKRYEYSKSSHLYLKENNYY